MRVTFALIILFWLNANAKLVPFPNGHHPVLKQAAKSGLVQAVVFQNKHYLVCKFNPKQYNIELFNRFETGTYTFSEIEKHKKRNLIFAMNAGMYEQDLSPVGLFVSGGKTHKEIDLATDKPGNFYQLKPNGVFIVDDQNNAHIITSEAYPAVSYKVNLATQSGPMLLIGGTLNSNFKEQSTNVNIRNGVGVDNKGDVVFIISLDKVNFYELAQLFKTQYNCDNALYMDGVISQYYAPELQKKPVEGVPLGTFITVSRKK
ncbi:phosphodiester glycosidase family protein [Mucilaginibacter sp. AW1-3]